MKIRKYVVLCLVWTTLVACSEEGEQPIDPTVGKWKRNFYQFSDLPFTHKKYEDLILPIPYVVSSTGIYDDKRYDLDIRKDKTFARKVVYNDNSSDSDDGTWEIKNNELVLNSNISSRDEVFKLSANSGTTMALYQRQTWRLLPDVVIDTLREEYFEENSQMLFDKYAKNVELNMYFFFKRVPD